MTGQWVGWEKRYCANRKDSNSQPLDSEFTALTIWPQQLLIVGAPIPLNIAGSSIHPKSIPCPRLLFLSFFLSFFFFFSFLRFLCCCLTAESFAISDAYSHVATVDFRTRRSMKAKPKWRTWQACLYLNSMTQRFERFAWRTFAEINDALRLHWDDFIARIWNTNSAIYCQCRHHRTEFQSASYINRTPCPLQRQHRTTVTSKTRKQWSLMEHIRIK